MKQLISFLACVLLALTMFAIGWAQKPEIVVQMLKSVDGIAFSPDGKYLAVCDQSSGVVSLWDIGTGAELREFRGNGEKINLAGFSPDGKILAGFWETEIDLWDVRTGSELRTLRMHEVPPAAEDSKALVAEAFANFIGRDPPP